MDSPTLAFYNQFTIVIEEYFNISRNLMLYTALPVNFDKFLVDMYKRLHNVL